MSSIHASASIQPFANRGSILGCSFHQTTFLSFPARFNHSATLGAHCGFPAARPSGVKPHAKVLNGSSAVKHIELSISDWVPLQSPYLQPLSHHCGVPYPPKTRVDLRDFVTGIIQKIGNIPINAHSSNPHTIREMHTHTHGQDSSSMTHRLHGHSNETLLKSANCQQKFGVPVPRSPISADILILAQRYPKMTIFLASSFPSKCAKNASTEDSVKTNSYLIWFRWVQCGHP